MGKTLVVIESPGKVNKLQKILGDDYLVIASVGHIMDLHPKDLSVDVSKKFDPTYHILDNKRSVVSKLRSAYKKCSDIIIATDRDREGEMIGHCISQVLKLKNPDRITYTEITKSEILKAIKDRHKLDQNLVDAAKARRVLDRLMGWELSPLISSQLEIPRLSVGRVQSVVTRLIIDRENEIRAFFENGFGSRFKFQGQFRTKKNAPQFKAILHDLKKKVKGGFSGPPSAIPEEEDARQLMKDLSKSTYTVSGITTSPSTRNPSPPFTTNSMQQEASRKLGLKPKVAMMAAQHLYEAGYITYMRTDSVNLSKEVMGACKKWILQEHGKEYHRPRMYKTKTKNAQEAHEAIRPTNVFYTSINTDSKKKIGSAELRLYGLIWRRAMASQMSPAKFDVTTVHIGISKREDHWMKATSEVITFDGFLRVWGIKAAGDVEEGDDEEEDDDTTLSADHAPTKGQKLITSELRGTQAYDQPPYRYNYSSLVNRLDPDNLNIGRPATYSDIIEKITEYKKYVKIGDIVGVKQNALTLLCKSKKVTEENAEVWVGKEKSKFIPLSIGEVMVEYLLDHFTEMFEYKFTSNMENLFDDISNGKVKWNKVIADVYKKFHPVVTKLEKTKPVVKSKFFRVLGKHPELKHEITTGMKYHGPTVMMCTDPEKKKYVYAPIREPLTIQNITLNDAVELLKYPKFLGKIGNAHVKLHTGMHGLYAKVSTKDKISIPKDIKEDDITLEKVKELIAARDADNLGKFTNGSKVYTVLKGKMDRKGEKRYPDYIKLMDGKKKYNISLPKDTDPSKLTLEKVEKIVEDWFNRPRRGGRRGKAAAKKDDKKASDKDKKKGVKLTKPKKKPNKQVKKVIKS